MKVINLFGGPGLGKSTLAAEIFTKFKKAKVNCELITEYAKDLTWQESFQVLANQIYVFGKQHQKLFRLNQKVDVVITDAPLINSIVYMSENNPHFYSLIKEEASKYENYNFLLQRLVDYDENGRSQNLQEAVAIDGKVRRILDGNKIDYWKINNLENAAQSIFDLVYDDIKREPKL